MASLTNLPVVPNFALCTTYDHVKRAVQTLSHFGHVVIDCEGKELGTTEGMLSLLCMGTPHAGDDQRIFVIDMLAVATSQPALQALAAFLARRDITKIVWDGRMDAVEILTMLGVRLARVLDLQIAEVCARSTVLHEDERQRAERLARGQFGFRVVRENRARLKGLHVVLGMQRCVEQFGLDGKVQKDAEVVAMHRANGSAGWLQRPLPQNLLQYAANDIYIIAELFGVFTTNGYVPSARTACANLIKQCDQYVSRCGHYLRVDQNDTFRPRGLLLIDALQASDGLILGCVGCRLGLSPQCFEVRVGQKAQLMRKAHCRLCDALLLKQQENTPADSWVPVV